MEDNPELKTETPQPNKTTEDNQEIQATRIDPKTGQPLKVQPVKTSTTTGKKKTKKTLILAIVAGLLLISAITAAILFFIRYNQPEVVAFDSVKNVYKAENVLADGTIRVDVDTEEDAIKNIEIKLNSTTTNKTTNSTTADINITATDDTKINLKVSEAFMKDGVIYIKLDGIQKAIKKLEQESNEIKTYTSMFEKSIKLADQQWWKISVPDVMKHLENKKLIQDGSSISEAYTCIIDELNSQDNLDQVFDIYKDNQFINIEKYTDNKVTATQGGRLYKLKVDAQKTVDFSKALQDSDTVKKLSNCAKKIDEGETSIETDIEKEDLDISEVKNEIEDLPEVILEISNWQHKLLRIYSESKENDSTSITDISLSYPKNTEIRAPENAKSVTKLIDQFITEIGTASLLYSNTDNSSVYTLDGTNTNINTSVKDYSISL